MEDVSLPPFLPHLDAISHEVCLHYSSLVHLRVIVRLSLRKVNLLLEIERGMETLAPDLVRRMLCHSVYLIINIILDLLQMVPPLPVVVDAVELAYLGAYVAVHSLNFAVGLRAESLTVNHRASPIGVSRVVRLSLYPRLKGAVDEFRTIITLEHATEGV